jgi:hypothetical protein
VALRVSRMRARGCPCRSLRRRRLDCPVSGCLRGLVAEWLCRVDRPRRRRDICEGTCFAFAPPRGPRVTRQQSPAAGSWCTWGASSTRSSPPTSCCWADIPCSSATRSAGPYSALTDTRPPSHSFKRSPWAHVQRTGVHGSLAVLQRPLDHRQDPGHHPAHRLLRRGGVRAQRCPHALHSRSPVYQATGDASFLEAIKKTAVDFPHLRRFLHRQHRRRRRHGRPDLLVCRPAEGEGRQVALPSGAPGARGPASPRVFSTETEQPAGNSPQATCFPAITRLHYMRTGSAAALPRVATGDARLRSA